MVNNIGNIIDLGHQRELRGRNGPRKDELRSLAKAQEMIYQAWEITDPIERVEIAEEALEISKLCADAWVLLAEDAADSPAQEVEFFQNGVTAGEDALGKQFFEKESGLFWGNAESRPYMRARAGLAHCLWDTGKKEEAIDHYRELLRLNPADNQGVRFVLLTSLLILNRHEEAYTILDSNPEDEYSATWAYSRALISFRESGDSRVSKEARSFATRANRYVPTYLAGIRKMPKFPPEYLTPGDKTEAVSYVYDNRQSWVDTEGAIDWLLKEHGV